MLTVMVRKDEIRRQVLEKARRQGSISYDEILSFLPDAERDVALLDDIMDDLLDAGIEVATVLETEPDETVLIPARARLKRSSTGWKTKTRNMAPGWKTISPMMPAISRRSTAMMSLACT